MFYVYIFDIKKAVFGEEGGIGRIFCLILLVMNIKSFRDYVLIGIFWLNVGV